MPKFYRGYRYAIFLVGRFKYLLLLALFAFLVSTAVLYTCHPDQASPATRRDLGEVSFGVFELMFASEPALPYPKGSLPAQIVYFALPVLNLLGLAAAVAQFSQILFDRGLYNRAQADHADGHVIVCGLGRLGREVLKQLDQRHHMKSRRDIVVVEGGPGADAVEGDLIRQEPIIPVVHGDMTHAHTLREAGIERAVVVMLLTGDDTRNLEAALLARELNPGVRVVLRMSSKRVLQRLDNLLRRGVIRNFQLVDSVAGAAPRCVELCGVTLADVDRRTASAMGVNPAGQAGHVIVCGLGRLGFGVVRLLKAHVPLVVVDHAEHLHYADEPTMVAEPVVPILRGDMTVKWVLQEAGVERASAVFVLTPDDAANLEAAMLVHELNPATRIVMRVNNSRVARRLDGVLREVLGDALRVIDPFEHAAPQFVEAVGAAYDAVTPGTSPSPSRNPATAGEGTDAVPSP
ncbi:MAG: NAD-binding protein [Planctomycetota bacterium]|nr:NAD-binding protein [Planctomycetota bacterium]